MGGETGGAEILCVTAGCRFDMESRGSSLTAHTKQLRIVHSEFLSAYMYGVLV